MSSKRGKWSELRASIPDTFEVRVVGEETDIAIRLGERVRAARLAAGWSQAELAQRAEMPQQSVARFEGGDVEPTIRTVLRLGRALGMDLIIDYAPPGFSFSQELEAAARYAAEVAGAMTPNASMALGQ